jgi:hypothetical protein
VTIPSTSASGKISTSDACFCNYEVLGSTLSLYFLVVWPCSWDPTDLESGAYG